MVSASKQASIRKTYGLADPAKVSIPKQALLDVPSQMPARSTQMPRPARASLMPMPDVDQLEFDPVERAKNRKTKARKSMNEERKRQSFGYKDQAGLEDIGEEPSFLEMFRWTLGVFARSTIFETGCGIVIVFSTIMITLEVDQADLPTLICFSENMVTSFFLFEWILRLCVFGLGWLKSFEHLLDTFIVWVPGVAIVWFIQPLAEDTSLGQEAEGVKIVRIIRMLRLLRLVKVFRFLPMMQDLWLLVRGLLSSGGTLVSAIVLIVFALYVFGIAAVDLIGRADYSTASEESKIAHSRFDGLWISMLTLTRFLHGDDSIGIMLALTDHQWAIWIFLWIFTACSSFVLLNLVTAVICNQAFETSKSDEEELAQRLKEQHEAEIEEFKAMFADLDEDGSGKVNLDEFQAAFKIPAFKHKLINMGLSEEQMMELFHTLDTDGEAELDLDEFVTGMQSLSGVATAKDMVLLTKGIERMGKSVTKLLGDPFGQGSVSVDMLQSQMTDARVKVDKRLRKTENSLEDLADYLVQLSESTLGHGTGLPMGPLTPASVSPLTPASMSPLTPVSADDNPTRAKKAVVKTRKIPAPRRKKESGSDIVSSSPPSPPTPASSPTPAELLESHVSSRSSLLEE